MAAGMQRHTWMSEMDLPSLQLQRDCAMSVTEGVEELDFAPFCLLTLTQ